MLDLEEGCGKILGCISSDLQEGMCCRVICGRLCAAYEQLVMKLRQYDTVVSHDRAHVGITGEEFHTMAPRAWLGDACINMYIALLQVYFYSSLKVQVLQAGA